MLHRFSSFFFFFFNDTATTEIYTLSLHDALPICRYAQTNRFLRLRRRLLRRLLRHFFVRHWVHRRLRRTDDARRRSARLLGGRSEEHTSELQSPCNLVCRLLLEKKKNTNIRRLVC